MSRLYRADPHFRARQRMTMRDPLRLRAGAARCWTEDYHYGEPGVTLVHVAVFYRDPQWRQHVLPRTRSHLNGDRQAALFDA